MLKGRILHVGSGGSDLPEWCGKCDEVKLDIDPRCNPDILADIMDMGEIGKFDVVFSSHVVEHFYEFQLAKVFSEFKRVLNDDGVIVVIVPDLEGVEATDEVLYLSYGNYPITGLDMIYGIPTEDNLYMGHHTGFTSPRLEKCLIDNGFKDVEIKPLFRSIMGVGRKC
jgi:SAM-dependent methyltransferase